MNIYIAGKITGDPDYKKKFALAEIALTKRGHTVMNPATIPDDKGYTWDEYMEISQKMQNLCDATYFLPDWQESKGARKEHVHALARSQKTFFSINEIPNVTGVRK